MLSLTSQLNNQEGIQCILTFFLKHILKSTFSVLGCKLSKLLDTVASYLFECSRYNYSQDTYLFLTAALLIRNFSLFFLTLIRALQFTVIFIKCHVSPGRAEAPQPISTHTANTLQAISGLLQVVRLPSSEPCLLTAGCFWV